MTNLDPQAWWLYVNEYIDRTITPFGLTLLKDYRGMYPNPAKLPKKTKVRGIYQRSLTVKTPQQAFMNRQEEAGFKQMKAALEATSAFADAKGSKEKTFKTKPVQTKVRTEQSFEAFLQDRGILEERRNQDAHQAFYHMVKEALTGKDPRAAKRAASTLVHAAKLDRAMSKLWRERTQIHLFHAWVDLLCLRILPKLKEH